MQIIPYNDTMQRDWDSFLDDSKNGTFLFKRAYMEYHKDRFYDCSVLFYHKRKVVGAFPATWHKKLSSVISHGGLTYGGLILSKDVRYEHIHEMFDLLCSYYSSSFQAKELIYKRIPSIYHRYPAEEDLYLLFKRNAQQVACGLSSAIKLDNHIKFLSSRMEGIKKAHQNNYVIQIATKDFLKDFWNILDGVLLKYHNTHPTHSFEEIDYLQSLFPEKIKAYVVLSGDIVIAGAILFEMRHVVHVQYIAANDLAKRTGALDFLFDFLINKIYTNKEFFDFGVSTENGGHYLNEGLLFQKEGFGGRGVCYTTYKLLLK